MKFRHKALGMLAGFGLLATAAVPAMAVDPAPTHTGTGEVEVELTDTGVFAVSIQNATLADVNISAGPTGATSSGSLQIKYEDSKTLRAGFWVTLSASDFTSDNIVVPPLRTNAGQPYKIAASNLKVTKNYNVAQGRWSSWAMNPAAGNLGYQIGDIGATSHGNDRDSSSGPFTLSDSDGSYHDWTSAANNTLNVGIGKDAPTVGFGFAGPGTAGPNTPTFGSLQLIKIALTIPAGQPADTYTSTLTVSIVPPGP